MTDQIPIDRYLFVFASSIHRGGLVVHPNLARQFWLTCALVFVTSSANSSDNVVHWINDASQSANTVLNSGSLFTTSFKRINDLQVRKLSGQVNPLFIDNYATNPGNNPSWITSFVGDSASGTGNGAAGRWRELESNPATSSGASSLQFDFAVSFAPGDRMLISDVDINEKYRIEAFVKVGSVFNAVPFTGWTHLSYTGQMGVAPDSRWASWNATSGQLVAGTGDSLNEPLDVLIPDQNIDRIIFTKLSGGGSPGLQFASERLNGDFNGDGSVDADDFVYWRKNNGTLDGYNIWRSNFGDEISALDSVFAGSATVPESNTIAMAASSSFVLWIFRPSRKRSAFEQSSCAV